MTQELTRRRTIGGTLTLAERASWHWLALAAILVLSAFLNLWDLTGEAYSNNYYSAAVKNMLTSWSNFFFVSFDAGFVSVDKPPLGLWTQAASAYAFGFHGWALLLPQAVAGVLSVALAYHLVRRTFGPVAGLLAALVLAITPIVVVTSRNNTADMLVVLTVLVAAWAVVRATETGSLRWLLLCAVVVGLSFNIKMLQAFLVLPAFYLLYLLAARTTWWRRIMHLGAATAVLLVVSLSWAIAVDLTPADERPYVGGSEGDSALNLAFGYNGAERLLGRSEGPGGPPGGGPGGVGENGEPGPLRLLNQQNAGQIGWLVPLAVVGLLVGGWQRFPWRFPLDDWQGVLVTWGTWLFSAGAYFSVSGYGHRHYLVMLAPAIAALVGIGLVALWNDYRSTGRRGWLLPLVLVGMAALQAYVLFDYHLWRAWLIPAVAAVCLLAAGGLTFARLRPSSHARAHGTLSEEREGGLPFAGPRPTEPEGPGAPGGPGGPGGPEAPGGVGERGREADPVLLEYLRANRGDATYLVAGASSMPLSPIILGTNEKVINLGGFRGRDPVFTADELSGLVDEGAVRFFLLQDRERMEEMRAERGAEREEYYAAYGTYPQGPPSGGPPGADNEAVTWVQDNREKVPQELWQSPEAEEGGGPEGVQGLYDCSVVGG